MDKASNIISQKLPLEKVEYFRTHMAIVSALLRVRLNSKEVDVLASFLSYKRRQGEEYVNYNSRKEVRKELKLSAAGLSNHLSKIIEKGYATRVGKEIIIQPFIEPSSSQQGYRIILINQG